MMAPSICAITFFGCTTTPGSTAAQTWWTLILPLGSSSETSTTAAVWVSSASE